MKQYILTTSFLFALFVFANGQSIEDALRFSQHTEGGTARSVAMGGAFGALGGDFSTLSSNPAGLGIYRKSEFTFTPEFYLSSTDTRYNLNEESDNKFNFNVSNLGYVAVFDKSGGAIKSVNFGIGFNRIANFHRNTTVVGENRNNSYGDYMAIEAYELGLETPNVDNFAYFSSDLFYQSYVIDYYYDADNGIDTFELGGWYFADDEHTPSGFLYPKQTVLTTERGRINEWAISLGINIGDMLYIGGTLGVQPVYYKQERNFIEEDDAGDLSYRYFNYNTDTIHS